MSAARNGYGNVEFNGLPALSNGYIVDGLETNDPLTNLNSGLSTNLVLGLNSISEVTVNTLSYSVDQGRYGASQVNYITKSGTNQFHGNLYELWNGSVMNAADYFTNATPGNHKPRSTVNHFGGSLGGPIMHNKLFFFFDSEWVRIALPIVYDRPPFPRRRSSNTCCSNCRSAAPTPSRDPLSACAATGAVLPEDVLAVRKHRRNAAGRPRLPFNADGSAGSGNPANGNGCANRQSVSHSSDDHEQVQTARIDYNIDRNNTTWFRFQADTGLAGRLHRSHQSRCSTPFRRSRCIRSRRATRTSFRRIWSTISIRRSPGMRACSRQANFQQTLAAFPIVLQGRGANAPFTTIGGLDNTWVQGRRATRFFINDNLAWSHGAHEFRFGTNTRIFRLNDYDFGEGTVPTVTYTTLPQFIYGVASTATETFPTSAKRAVQLSQSGSLCAGHLEGDSKVDLDLRRSRYTTIPIP